MRGESIWRYLRSQEAKRTFLAALLFACLTVIIFWGYLDGGNALVGSDGMGPPADFAMMEAESSYFSAWRAFPALGHLNFPSPTLSSAYFIAMEVLGLSPVTVTQLIIVLGFWLAGFGMYICAYRIVGNYFAGLMAGVAYVFNQVLLSQVTEAHHYFVFGCAIFPLLFLILYRALMDFDRRSAIALPVAALALGTVAPPNLILITSVFLIIFILAFALTARKWSLSRRAYALIVGAICVGLVLLPTVLMKFTAGGTPVLGTYYPIEQARLYSSYTLYNSFIMSSSENTFIFGSSIGQWTIIGSLWTVGLIVAVVVPLMALCSLLIKSRRHLVISLLIPATLFIIIATGPNPPFGDIFTYFFKNIPLMDSIRVYSRFHLLTGFAVAMLIAIVFAHAEEVQTHLSKLRGLGGKSLGYLFGSRKRMAVLLVFCLVFPSSALITGEVRSFTIPDSYLAPYEWVGEQDGDFRIVNLPFQNVFYVGNQPHYDGYPMTMTMDVGMYSPTYSQKPYAFGLETLDYWTFVGATYSGEEFGYLYLSELLGGTASVRYIVAQEYASDAEVRAFLSMNGVSLEEVFPGGGAVLLNDQWTPRVHPIGQLVLTSGDRSAIPLIMGAGLANLTSDGIVLIRQMQDPDALDALLSQSDLIVVPNGDILGLIADMNGWESGQMVDLQSHGDKHTCDTSATWMLYNTDYHAGYASQPTLTTSGRHNLTIPVTTSQAGQYDLLTRVVFRPDAGLLNISLDGNQVLSLSPQATDAHSEWVRVENITLPASAHDLEISNDGTGLISLDQMVLVPHNSVEEKIDEAEAILAKYQDKVVYLYSASHSSQWTSGTYLDWLGEEGWGISNSLHFPSTELVPTNLTWVYDPAASTSIALKINSTGLELKPMVRGLEGGSNYTGTLSLRIVGDPIGTTVGTVLVYGTDRKTGITSVLGTAILEDNGSPAGVYSNYSFNFTVPEGVNQLQFGVSPGIGAELLLDQLIIERGGSTFPQLGMDFPRDGSYTLKMTGFSTAAEPFVQIDGSYYPLSRTDGTTLEFDIDNVTKGQHVVEVGVSNVYAVNLGPKALNHSPAASVSLDFQRSSNIEYQVQINTDGPTWVLVSESYSPLWVAEMDGKELAHVQVNSMVNAFYVPEAGNHTITVKFHGQEIYDGILQAILIASAASMAVLAILQNPQAQRYLGRQSKRSRGVSLTSLWGWWKRGKGGQGNR